ncbi:hypothetical protein TSUD_374780 [Trifolium subterraneum]|uniref:Uncharacterized protein n=1 Tax=Trifolium subterraneum TaxID=3900 RepID=A0A2Z6P103_TRISU|nr:hypothetical protein TSUD_374780 [Trifolium subterraneum]
MIEVEDILSGLRKMRLEISVCHTEATQLATEEATRLAIEASQQLLQLSAETSNADPVATELANTERAATEPSNDVSTGAGPSAIVPSDAETCDAEIAARLAAQEEKQREMQFILTSLVDSQAEIKTLQAQLLARKQPPQP